LAGVFNFIVEKSKEQDQIRNENESRRPFKIWLIRSFKRKRDQQTISRG
jgi:hypothetical protein